MARYIDTLKRVVEGDYTGATDQEKDQAVAEVKKVGSAAAAAVAIQPFPLIDVALVSPIQILMVQGIARVRGFKLDRRAVMEILSTFGASILAQNAILAAAKFVPFAGWLVSISMAYALTYALAEVADYYFRSGRGVSADELKQMFDRIYRQKRAEKEAQHKENATLKDKLKQLKDAFRSGLLTEEQYEKKKEDLLASF
ncbi:MAG: DUF697 domain-containing protein [Deltaproteobacteria bacterium]|nr:DUF697 domain-containing protein [Deltaproteobacteria bacterium]